MFALRNSLIADLIAALIAVLVVVWVGFLTTQFLYVFRGWLRSVQNIVTLLIWGSEGKL